MCIQIKTWLEGRDRRKFVCYLEEKKEGWDFPVNYTMFTTCFAGAQ